MSETYEPLSEEELIPYFEGAPIFYESGDPERDAMDVFQHRLLLTIHQQLKRRAAAEAVCIAAGWFLDAPLIQVERKHRLQSALNEWRELKNGS